MVHFIWMINISFDNGENEIEGQGIESDRERVKGEEKKRNHEASSGKANLAKSTNIKYFVIKQVRRSYHLKIRHT